MNNKHLIVLCIDDYKQNKPTYIHKYTHTYKKTSQRIPYIMSHEALFFGTKNNNFCGVKLFAFEFAGKEITPSSFTVHRRLVSNFHKHLI